MSERQKKKLAQKEANRLKRRMIEKVLSSSKTGNVAFNLNLLVDGWLELESDPGTFSLLIEDFGCYGAQVDEIYDLEQKFDGPVLGFIFLFKWLNNQRNDRQRNQKSTSTITNNNHASTSNNINNTTNTSTNNNSTNKPGCGPENSTSISSSTNASNSNTVNDDCNKEQQPPTHEQKQWSYVEDENILSEIFFAKQMISNSCATHALISILLNCDYDRLNLGPILTRLKEHTKVMNPENKGYAIGNLPELSKAHNSHASYSSLYNRNKPYSHTGMSYVISGNQRTNLQQQNQHDAYHFVSYVPIKNRLYELDGLKNYPIDHGPFDAKEGWTEKFRRVIKQRLNGNLGGEDSCVSNDIRYNLMAVVPDRRVCLRIKLRKLKRQQRIIQHGVERLTKYKPSTICPIENDIPNPPYSPLSNGTLTASEGGSDCETFAEQDASAFSDDNDGCADRYFFVKFDKNASPAKVRDENIDAAHKSCIIEIESTNAHPINLTVESNKNIDKVNVEKSNDVKSSDNNDNTTTNKTTITTTTTTTTTTSITTASTLASSNNIHNNNNSIEVDEDSPVEAATVSPNDQVNDNTIEADDRMSIDGGDVDEEAIKTQDVPVSEQEQPLNEHTKCSLTNGLAQNGLNTTKINETKAHSDEKQYNLSSVPPFDFNILDEMQHVHYGKSTLREMKSLSNLLQGEIRKLETSLKDEIDKRRKYKIDNSRRTHNYEPFIMTFLSMLAKHGNLADLIEKDLGIFALDTPVAKALPHKTVAATPQATTPRLSQLGVSAAATTPKQITTPNRLSTTNGNKANDTNISQKPKPKYKYVSTGRPVGRPRKNPLIPPPAKKVD